MYRQWCGDGDGACGGVSGGCNADNGAIYIYVQTIIQYITLYNVITHIWISGVNVLSIDVKYKRAAGTQ